MSKKLHIINYGCQMNQADAEKIRGMLGQEGYTLTEKKEEADFIFINTCSIREKAEEKVYGRIGQLKKLKKLNPSLIIGVGGCVAQQEGANLQKRAPHVDLVMGTFNLHQLPILVKQRESEAKPVVSVLSAPEEIAEDVPTIRDNPYVAKVPVIYGCNYNCTYCIVPAVRGPEISRTTENIVKEVKGLAAEGTKEVLLLGQNVNSYGQDLRNGTSFSKLLREINTIEGIKRIRFMTSHPKDMSLELIETMARLEKVCEQLHLPVQSGDDEVLANMARQYTTEEYRSVVKALREAMPDLVLTTDIIVGFPGESREQYERTLAFMEEMAFDGVNTAAYSPRPGTFAAEMQGQVDPDEKKNRLWEINKRVTELVYKSNQKLLGNTYEILVERPSKENPNVLEGYTRGYKRIFIEGNPGLLGKLVKVRVTKAGSWSIFGEVVL